MKLQLNKKESWLKRKDSKVILTFGKNERNDRNYLNTNHTKISPKQIKVVDQTNMITNNSFLRERCLNQK